MPRYQSNTKVACDPEELLSWRYWNTNEDSGPTLNDVENTATGGKALR